MSLKCWTAPGKVFESREELHEHYKSDWHQYNLKRKVANLPPVPLAMFQKLQQIQAERERVMSAQVKGKAHIKKTKRPDEMPNAAEADAPAPPAEDGGAAEAAVKPASTEKEETAEEYDVDTEEMKKPVDYNVCFLDGHVSESFEENLLYMKKNFGFVVPEMEYCTDLQALFRYCNKKVMAGKICLGCDRPFKNGEAAIQHMIAKTHCKISMESEENFDEFEEFYDFSALESDSDSEGGCVEVDEEWDGKEATKAALPSRKKKDKLEVDILDSGELCITNKTTGSSKVLGHRDFRDIYAQRFRPEESNLAVLANTKERLLLMYKQAGVETSGTIARTMYNGGRPAWMDKKFKRDQKRDVDLAKRRELQNGVNTNLLTKHRLRQFKNMGEGYGVHG